MAQEIVKVIKIDASSSSKSINQLKKELNDLKKTLQSTKVGSKEYESTLKQLGNVQRQYANILDDVKSRTQSTGQMFRTLNSFANGLAKSYSAINAAVNLLGAENEDLDKSLVKVARTIQLIQGLSGFGDLINQLPRVIGLFKNLFSAIDPVERSIGRIAKDLSDIDTSKLRMPDQGAATTTTATATGGGGAVAVKQIEQQNQALKQQTTYYPALLKQEKDLYKARENTAKQLAKTQQSLQEIKNITTKTMTAFLKGAQESGMSMSELTDLMNQYKGDTVGLLKELQKLPNINENFAKSAKDMGLSTEYLTKNAQLLSSTYADNYRETERLTQEYSKLDAQYKEVNEQIQLQEAGMTKFQKTLARTGVVGRTAMTMIKTALISIGIGLLIEGLVLAAKWIGDIIKASQKWANINKEIAKSMNQIGAKQVAILKELAFAYQKVGDSAEDKKKFIEEYNEKIKETGINVTNVNQADDVFIKNTNKYISAIMARAKAQATENKAIQLYQEYLDQQADLESKLEKKRKVSKEQFIALLTASGSTMEQAEEAWYEGTTRATKKITGQLEENEKDIEATLKRLFTDVANLDKEYYGLMGDMATTTVTTTTTNGNSVKDNTERDLELLAQYYKAARDLFKDARTKELDDTRAKYAEQIELAKKYGQDTVLLEQARDREIAEIIERYRKQAADERKAAIDAEIAELQESIERIRKMYATSSLRNPQDKNFQTTYKQSPITTLLGLGKDWTNVYQSKGDVEKQFKEQIEYNNKLLEITKSRIEQENELLNKQLEVEGITADRREEIQRTLAENLMAYEDAITANEQANLNAYLSMQEKRQQALNSVLTVTSNMLAGISSMYKTEMSDTTKSEEQRVKAAKTYKALAITQATVDTYKAANEAYAAMASVPYVGPALGIAAAAAAIISGIANVKAIISESNSVASNVGASSATVSGSAVDAPVTIDYPVEYTRNLLGDREVDEMNKPIKVYVLESDITKVQNKVRVVEENASF